MTIDLDDLTIKEIIKLMDELQDEDPRVRLLLSDEVARRIIEGIDYAVQAD